MVVMILIKVMSVRNKETRNVLTYILYTLLHQLLPLST